MTREQRLKEIEKIWKKHATGRQNMIATFLPHANQKAFLNELNEFIDSILPNTDPVAGMESFNIKHVNVEK